MNHLKPHTQLAVFLADQFSAFPQVEGIVLGGSHAARSSEPGSDLDLYIFTNDVVPIESRRAVFNLRGVSRADFDLRFWDLGDQWIDLQTGIEVDLIYWDTVWIEDQISQVLVFHKSSLGYTTCHWNTIKQSIVLFDRNGWFCQLKRKCDQPYPELLRQAIIKTNYPILRDVIPSYINQIRKAVGRSDLVSINHRVAALLASYFDILYAINGIPHPGEKRLLHLTQKLCSRIPTGMVDQVERVLRTAGNADPNLISALEDLINGLDLLLTPDEMKLIRRD